MKRSLALGSREFSRSLSKWMGMLKRGLVSEIIVTLHGLPVWRMTSCVGKISVPRKSGEEKR